MRTLIRTLPLALAASLLVLFALACESGGGSDGKTTGDLVSADPVEVLAASGESFEQDVDSLQAELLIGIDAGGLKLNMSSDMAFQAPDRMHATMDVTGLGTSEMILLGKALYMDMPGQGWVEISLDDAGLSELGLDASTFEKLVTNHSMVDYKSVVENLGGEVDDLGRETLDGDSLQHYRTALDFGEMAAAFSDAFGAAGDLGLESVSGPLTLDVWVDPDTTLPYKVAANGEFAFGAGSMAFDATMRFFGYNEPVEIPGAPPDAVPFALLGGP